MKYFQIIKFFFQFHDRSVLVCKRTFTLGFNFAICCDKAPLLLFLDTALGFLD